MKEQAYKPKLDAPGSYVQNKICINSLYLSLNLLRKHSTNLHEDTILIFDQARFNVYRIVSITVSLNNKLGQLEILK